MKTVEDDDIRGALQSDKTAVDRAIRLMIDRYGKDVYSTAYRILGSTAEAQDIQQETFIKVVERPRDFAQATSMRAYLCKVAAHLSVSSLRKTKRRASKDRERFAAEGDGLTVVAAFRPSSEGQRSALLSCLEAVDPDTRAAFYLRVLYELSWDEIGDVIGTTAAAARVSVRRAEKKLRACMEGREKTS